MARNTSVSLGDHFTGFVDQQVESGRYGSVSDVVRAGLRMLEDREAQNTALRAELRKGEESGPSLPFDAEAFLKEKRERFERQ
ncbi:MAG: type II toxin-antitoxin system ParD family antitoxin [Thermomicrobiales bacterium]